jgi:predicted PurR-regulated permease PerM
MADENDLLNKFTEDNEQRTAIRFAFYNTIFFVLLAICAVGLYAVYQMLHLFLTPILWATLVGTVLFPLKRSLSSVFKGEFL